MCVGIWSLLSYVKDSNIIATVALPEVPAYMKEDELATGWDSILGVQVALENPRVTCDNHYQ